MTWAALNKRERKCCSRVGRGWLTVFPAGDKRSMITLSFSAGERLIEFRQGVEPSTPHLLTGLHHLESSLGGFSRDKPRLSIPLEGLLNAFPKRIVNLLTSFVSISRQVNFWFQLFYPFRAWSQQIAGGQIPSKPAQVLLNVY